MTNSQALTKSAFRGFAIAVAPLLLISVVLWGIALAPSLASESTEEVYWETTTESTDTVVNVSNNTFVAVPVVAASPTPTPTPTPTPPDRLSITKTDDRESVEVGSLVTYRIRVKNPNNDDRTEVKIVDHVPQYLIPVKITPAGIADARTRTITWNDQTISALADVTYSYTARVDHSAPDGFVLVNTVEMNGPGVRGSATDVTAVNNPAIAAPPAPPAPPLTVSAPRPVPLAPRTGMDVTGLLIGLGSALSGFGAFLLRRNSL